jgi:hypothetical protein
MLISILINKIDLNFVVLFLCVSPCFVILYILGRSVCLEDLIILMKLSESGFFYFNYHNLGLLIL